MAKKEFELPPLMWQEITKEIMAKKEPEYFLGKEEDARVPKFIVFFAGVGIIIGMIHGLMMMFGYVLPLTETDSRRDGVPIVIQMLGLLIGYGILGVISGLAVSFIVNAFLMMKPKWLSFSCLFPFSSGKRLQIQHEIQSAKNYLAQVTDKNTIENNAVEIGKAQECLERAELLCVEL